MSPIEKQFFLALAFQALTPFAVLIIMFRRRITSLKRKEVSIKHFRTYSTEHHLPESVLAAGRNFSNQFEVPVLFLVAGVLTIALKQVDSVLVFLGWSFVFCRIIHAFIHLGKNNVIYRMRIFGISCLVLLIMWIYLIGKICL